MRLLCHHNKTYQPCTLVVFFYLNKAVFFCEKRTFDFVIMKFSPEKKSHLIKSHMTFSSVSFSPVKLHIALEPDFHM